MEPHQLILWNAKCIQPPILECLWGFMRVYDSGFYHRGWRFLLCLPGGTLEKWCSTVSWKLFFLLSEAAGSLYALALLDVTDETGATTGRVWVDLWSFSQGFTGSTWFNSSSHFLLVKYLTSARLDMLFQMKLDDVLWCVLVPWIECCNDQGDMNIYEKRIMFCHRNFITKHARTTS